MDSANNFGRLRAPLDGRDFRFMMRAMTPQIIAVSGKPKPRTSPYRLGPVLDQGQTSQCVGYASRSFLDAAPIMSKAIVGPSATDIYRAAQELDEWPGTNYDGTSVRAAMKVLQAGGHCPSYVWGQTIDDAIAWMNGGYGTIIVGTNWYAEMSSVDSDGFMREPASSLTTPLGGHAWLWVWYDAKRKGILMRNSWGHDFGQVQRGKTGLSGTAYLRPEFAKRLLLEDGECAAPTQVKVTPVVPK